MQIDTLYNSYKLQYRAYFYYSYRTMNINNIFMLDYYASSYDFALIKVKRKYCLILKLYCTTLLHDNKRKTITRNN